MKINKLSYQVEVVPLVKSGKITTLGHQYLLGVIREKDADDFRCGPFPMWLHDIGIVFGAVC